MAYSCSNFVFKLGLTYLLLVLEDDVEISFRRCAGVAIGPLNLDVAERLEGRHENLLRDVPGDAA